VKTISSKFTFLHCISFVTGLWPIQTKSNVQIGEHDSKGVLEPKKNFAKSCGSAPKNLTSIKPTSKKLNMVKLPPQEITAVFSEVHFFFTPTS